MRIVLAVKPYDIEVYSERDGAYLLAGVESITRIEGEAASEYERRMTFVIKELCTEMRAHDFFKKEARSLSSIDIVLCAPWCTYEAMRIEKTFEQPTKVTDQLVQSLHVTKVAEGIEVVESSISQILLNGYSVDRVAGQQAETIELQYLATYATTTFLQGLRRTVEGIFHTHKVNMLSIYNHMEKEASKTPLTASNEFRVLLEEESIDISYLSHGQGMLNFFVPYSYRHIEEELQTVLGTEAGTVAEVLISRTATMHGTDMPASKNAKHLWPDLDQATKEKIERVLSAAVATILGHVRASLDAVDRQYLKESTAISVYGLNKKIISACGYELAAAMVADGYLSSRLQLSTNDVFVKKIF